MLNLFRKKYNIGDVLRGKKCNDVYLITGKNEYGGYEVKELYINDTCELRHDSLNNYVGTWYNSKQIKDRFKLVKKDKLITWLRTVTFLKINGKSVELKCGETFLVNQLPIDKNNKYYDKYYYINKRDIMCNDTTL